jgi:hypothetical protein
MGGTLQQDQHAKEWEDTASIALYVHLTFNKHKQATQFWNYKDIHKPFALNSLRGIPTSIQEKGSCPLLFITYLHLNPNY